MFEKKKKKDLTFDNISEGCLHRTSLFLGSSAGEGDANHSLSVFWTHRAGNQNTISPVEDISTPHRAHKRAGMC